MITCLILLDLQTLGNLWRIAAKHEKNITVTKKSCCYFLIIIFNSKVLKHYHKKICYKIPKTVKPNHETK